MHMYIHMYTYIYIYIHMYIGASPTAAAPESHLLLESAGAEYYDHYCYYQLII